MKRTAVPSLLALAALLLAACVGTTTVVTVSEQSESPAPSYLRGFTLISDAEEPAIGRILKYDGALIGSGVLISSTHVLTAGHVMEGTEAYWFETNGTKYCIEQTHMHPLYKIKDVFVVDAALLVLSEPCTEQPVCLGSSALLRGESLTAVGHGGGFRKRSDPGVFWYYGTLMEDPFNLKMLCYEGTVWFGDSGGAVLDFQGKLVGIISSLGGRRGYIYENTAVRVDLLLPWINDIMEDNECNSPALNGFLFAP
jgi:S1-C subfamily serine protease